MARDSDATSDVRQLATLPDVLSHLSSLQSHEAQLSASLADLLSAREPVEASLTSLQSLLPDLDALRIESSNLRQTVSVTAKTADHVGGRVRTLDEEMKRVREASERVGQIIELKTSLAALQFSMDSGDWESATRHCARAMALPIEVISGPFAETAVPTQESHLPPSQTLQAAREALLETFRTEFENASRLRDASATTRFFKLFPAIGWEAEGLQAYASFVLDLVQVRAPAFAKTSSPLYYVTALTALFENIAMIIDQHQPVVEKYYGPGKMGLVLDRLLQEADDVVRSLMDGWEEERAMKRKLADVTTASSQARQTQSAALEDDDLVDPREIDKVLTEMAAMGGRWGLFRKFMNDRLKGGSDSEDDASGQEDEAEDDPAPSIPRQKGEDDSSSEPEGGWQVLEDSACRKLFEDMLSNYYTPLEVWYARSVIDKAHRLSTPDLSQMPLSTTAPDDVFYILKSVLSRMLTTASVSAVSRSGDRLREVMDRDYGRVIKKKLDGVYKGGAAPGARGEKVDRENRQAFVTLLNDLDVSCSHTERLVKDLLGSSLISQHFLDSEVEDVKASIGSFNTLVPKFRSTLRAGVEQLFNQLLRPKLRTFILDVYKDVSYVLDEDSYGSAEYQDVVRKRFVTAWEALFDGYKDYLTESNYRSLFGLALDVLIRPWEKFVISLKYSELGAVRFDHDLRAVVGYLSSQTPFGDIREKLVRLQQIATLLNLDSEEDVDEFYNGSGISWQLSQNDARSIAGLRV